MAQIPAQGGGMLFGSEVFTWGPMTLGDVGSGVGSPGSGDRTVQVVGTFGAGTSAVVEGTIDNTNWFTLRDPSGASLSFGSAGLKAIMENVLALRPRVATGDGTEQLTVTLLTRSPRLG